MSEWRVILIATAVATGMMLAHLMMSHGGAEPAELPPHPVFREWPGAVERGDAWPLLKKVPPDGRFAVVSIQFKPYDMTIYCLLFQLDDADGNYDRARTMPSDLGALPSRCDYLLLWNDERQVWIAPGWN